MGMKFKAAVLHSVGEMLVEECVELGQLGPHDVLVKVRAAGLCHTDLEVIDGSLHLPLPMVLGHEASGIVEEIGTDAQGIAVGDHVILSWNPNCGHCFHCERDQPILCDTYLANTSAGFAFDGHHKLAGANDQPLHQIMFLGAFAEYCVVQDQQAIVIPREMPFDAAALVGCGVMTGVGAAINVAQLRPGMTVMVIGCGAVGLAAVQGAALAGARKIIAVDLNPARLKTAGGMGATCLIDASRELPADRARQLSGGRGVDVVLESAGSEAAFRLSMEAVRPGGQVVWLGKTDVNADVAFRWGSLMQEKRITRSSYGGARPRRDFPFLCDAYLEGRLNIDALISQHITLGEVNQGFERLRRGETIRSVIMFGDKK